MIESLLSLGAFVQASTWVLLYKHLHAPHTVNKQTIWNRESGKFPRTDTTLGWGRGATWLSTAFQILLEREFCHLV